MPKDHQPPDPPAGGESHVVAVIDESLRASFLQFDAVDRRTLGGLEPKLTCAQFHALVALEQHPGLSLSALAEKLFCAKANASGVVERLRKDALVEKEPDPHDARRIRLTLTAKGARVLVTAKRRRHEEQAKLLIDFQRAYGVALDDVAHFMSRLVTHLRDALADMPSASRHRRGGAPNGPQHG